MRQLVIIFHLIVLFFSPLYAFGQDAAEPCNESEYTDFDFWIGEWDVYLPNGDLSGTNSITKGYGGCVVHERYQNNSGFSGESLNMYDKSRDVWHQTWVDTTGRLLRLEGKLENGAMILKGVLTEDDGTQIDQRITWVPNQDGSVRQTWEKANPEGEWEILFDGIYRRQSTQ